MKRTGSIVIFALMMLSLIAIVTEQLIRSTIIGTSFIKTMIDREHAEMLALGGINVAIAQLNKGLVADKKEEKKDKAAKEGREETAEEKKIGEGEKGELTAMQKFIYHLLSHLNRWQVFRLSSVHDGIDGEVRICLSSEHGKININEAFDFKKNEFKKEYEAMLKTLEIPGKLPLGEFHKRMVEFLKKRGKKLYDVSELTNISNVEVMDIFYHPPQKPQKRQSAEPNSSIYLNDVFTLWTDDAKLDPLVFSDALCAIFGLRRPRATDPHFMKEEFKKIAAAFKKEWGADWDGNWKFLQPIYGEKPKALEPMKDIFSKSFNSKVYSVLSYGKVNNVEQRVLAIVKEVEEKPAQEKKGAEAKKEQETPEKPAQEKEAKKEKKRYFKIIRIYWL